MPGTARQHQLERSLFYHVYNRSHRGEFIFESKDDFKHFSDLLYRFKEDGGVNIYHWVIMSNHYHLCIKLDRPESVSGRISGLQRAYTYYYHRTRKTVGYLWQGRFKSQPIEGEKYLMACGRYIERNPVRAGMVKLASDYIFSSAQHYCLGRADEITDTDLFYDNFGATIKDRQIEYCSYLRSYNDEEEQLFRDHIRPVGSQVFKARLVKIGRHYFPIRRGRPRKIGDGICS